MSTDLNHRLVTLIENIFEAEDSLAAEVNPEDLDSNKYFFIDPDDASNKVLLENKIVAELTYLAQKVGKIGGSQSSATILGGVMINGKGKEKETNGTQDWTALDIKRLLDILSRAFAASSSGIAFPKDGFGGIRAQDDQPFKPKGRGKKGGKGSPVKAENDAETLQLDEGAFEKCKRRLERLAGGVGAAHCCLAILGTAGLPKRVSCFIHTYNLIRH